MAMTTIRTTVLALTAIPLSGDTMVAAEGDHPTADQPTAGPWLFPTGGAPETI